MSRPGATPPDALQSDPTRPVLAVDLGTTNFKAALFDPAGAMLALARLPTPTRSPQPGRGEIPVADFHQTLTDLLADLRSNAPTDYDRTAAISFATQTNTFVLLDADDQPLAPLILWNDRRAAEPAHAEAIQPTLDRLNALPHRVATTGLPAVGPLHAPAKLHWLRDHDPDLWRRARRFHLISDHFTHWLTGRHVTEAGAAGLTGLLDIHQLQWWPHALAVVDHPDLQMPEPMRAGSDLGPIRPDIAATLQLPADCRCILGCLDQYAGPIGVGASEPPNVCETTGTVLAVVQCAEAFDPALTDRGVIQGPAYREGRYFRMAFSGVSGQLLEAYRRNHAPELTFDTLGELAGQALQRGDATALDVARSEIDAEPRFHPPPPDHGPAVLAIMRAVADRLRQQVETVCGDHRPDRIFSAGGGARSDLWRDLKQQALGLPIHPSGVEEPTCRGAARLATPRHTRNPNI